MEKKKRLANMHRIALRKRRKGAKQAGDENKKLPRVKNDTAAHKSKRETPAKKLLRKITGSAAEVPTIQLTNNLFRGKESRKGGLPH